MSMFINPTTIKINRYAQTNTKGRISITLTESFDVEAEKPQPASGSFIENNPELRNAQEVLEVLCEKTAEITVGVDGAPTDKVLYDAKEYDVYKIWDLDDGLLPHYEMVIKR